MDSETVGTDAVRLILTSSGSPAGKLGHKAAVQTDLLPVPSKMHL